MIGKRLGIWTLEAEVGHGAMGKVYRASAADGRIAAVKVLSPDLANDDLFIGRFRREVEALRLLHHSRIVQYFDSGDDDGHTYLAMEFISGGNYEQRMQSRGRLPWAEALLVARQIAEALKHAHDNGVIHRDLKPANVLLNDEPDGSAGVSIKLTDFGVAKLFASAPLTAAGSFVGTAAYLAPEQAAGKPASKMGDFYSLGCVLYALVTGRPPFAGGTITEVLHQHRFAQPEQPIRLVPDLPHDINTFIMRLLEKDPTKRPSDGSVVLKTIDRIAGKLERKGKNALDTCVPTNTDATVLQSTRVMPPQLGPGPATFAANFVRTELNRLNAGGPITRLLNNPLVLVPLFLLCVAGIVYGIWRPQPSAESLMNSAQPLMTSSNPSDWERAWHESLQPLRDRYPDQYRDEIAAFRKRIDDYHERRKAKSEVPTSEAERFYRRGVQRLQDGESAAARRSWMALIAAFDGIESDRRWVQAARDALAELDKAEKLQYGSAQAAIERARRLKAEGKVADAKAILDALESLYSDDPDATELVDAIRKER